MGKRNRDDEEFDRFINSIRDVIEEEQIGEFVRDDKKTQIVEVTMKYLKKIVDCDRIFCKYDTPFQGSADIIIIGREITVKNPVVFGELLKYSQVSEMYPKTDGTVQVAITYYGTSRKVRK